MTGKRILLVEDDMKIQSFNKELFEGRGFIVNLATTLFDAKIQMQRNMPDAIVLDVNLPDGSGFDFLRELRQTSRIPVLVLTGYGEDKDVVVGFESGCNDYLSKPYTFEVLHVRLNNLLQSAEQMPDNLSVGVLKLDLLSNRAFIEDNDLNLTEKEFVLIRLLMQHEGDIIGTEDIYEKVWGQPMLGDKNALQVAITRLRKKIEPAGYNIVSMRGKGYMLANN